MPARNSPAARLAALLLSGALLAAPAAAQDWRVELVADGALFPVLDLSQPRAAAPFGDGAGLLQVEVRAARDGERVRLRVQAPHLARSATLDAVLPRAGARYRLRPALDWDRARVAALDVSVDEVLQLRLDSAAGTAERRVTARLHPLDEAPYFVRDGAEHVDLSWIFAAYADPQDAAVDALLARVRDAHPRLALDGYASGEAEAVLAQAYALWEALSTHGVRYAEEDPGRARGPRLWSQHVRRAGEVWSERRANCLDGSLLLAAAAERIGLRAVLLLVPRHALLALYTRADAGAPVFIETTALGARHGTTPAPPPFRARLEGDSDPAALASFQAALAAGSARYHAAARRFGRHDPDYQWIDLATARSYGILPLSAASARAAASPRP